MSVSSNTTVMPGRWRLNAAAQADNVVGLVFVAAFAPDEGERLGEVSASSKDSVLNSALVPLQDPTADGGTATEFAIDPAKAREAFAGEWLERMGEPDEAVITGHREKGGSRQSA